ncbi:MAG: amidohydrolase family protein [Terriglobales bacterium]
MRTRTFALALMSAAMLVVTGVTPAQFLQHPPPPPPVLVEAAAMLNVHNGQYVRPARILIENGRIAAMGANVTAPAGVKVLDLGNLTLLPGLIDTHVHMFLHPMAYGHAPDESGQTIHESVPERTIIAVLQAKLDLMAGFTSEKDMGTEGAGPADTALRQAINDGEIPGPRLWISGNAISMVGGHEAIYGYNPAILIPQNADMVTGVTQMLETIRRQHYEGSTFVKIYETGREYFHNGVFHADYQFPEPVLAAAVKEAARLDTFVSVHDQGEPGTLYAAQAGVASIDHATQLGPETMQLMIQKHIFAVPTFTVFIAFHSKALGGPGGLDPMIEYKAQQFRKQLKAGVPIAMGSDVGPFPHGTQNQEFYWLVHFGMSPLGAIQAGTINAAELLRDAKDLGSLDVGKYADIVGVNGDPLQNIKLLEHVQFVMKGGEVYKNGSAN